MDFAAHHGVLLLPRETKSRVVLGRASQVEPARVRGDPHTSRDVLFIPPGPVPAPLSVGGEVAQLLLLEELGVGK